MKLTMIRNSDLPPRIQEVGVYSRIRLARGECRALARSTFNVLEKHFPDMMINYFFEGERHYFLVEDFEGIFYEVRIWFEEQDG